MKKYLLLPLLALLAVAVCVSCDLVEDDPAVTTAETEAPTEIVTDLGHDDPTEPPTETLTEPALTETKVIPTDTLEPVVFEDESLNAVVDSLRENQHNMEQLAFPDTQTNGNFVCDVYLNHRFFTEGDRLQVSFANATVDDAPADLAHLARTYGTIYASIIGDDGGQLLVAEVEQENLLTFVTPIHEGLAPGVYHVMLLVKQEQYNVCPILIYDADEGIPSEPTIYDNDFVNSCLNELREQGHNMEKLSFSYWEGAIRYGYIVSLHTRVVCRGETVDAILTDVISHADFVRYDSYPKTDPPVILKNKETGSYFVMHTEDDTRFTVTIPNNAEPGIYYLTLSLGESSIYVCPIVIY